MDDSVGNPDIAMHEGDTVVTMKVLIRVPVSKVDASTPQAAKAFVQDLIQEHGIEIGGVPVSAEFTH